MNDKLVTNSITSAHLGNGLSVWRKGSNDIIAHIGKDRNINYMKVVTIKEAKQIIDLAKYDNRNISVTQDEKVFITPPYKNK